MQWVIPGIALVVILIFATVYLLNRSSNEVSKRGEDDVSDTDNSADSGSGTGSPGDD
jgi:hypothetical protein